MDQILLVNIGGNIVLNDVHLPPGWGEVCISCVLRTLVGGGGHCRTGCSEPDCDRCGGTVSLLHTCASKREKQTSSCSFPRSVAGFLASWVTLFSSASPTPRHYWTRVSLAWWWSAKARGSARLRHLPGVSG